MLELYQKESCPYCAKVRRKMEELDLDYVCRTSVKGSPKREILKQLGGQEMVPFLVDTADPKHVVMMYESDDIIAYLEKTYGSGSRTLQADDGKKDTDSPVACPIK